MKYQITGKNIEVTEAIAAAIETKLSRMDKYFAASDEILCRALVSHHIGVDKVEITIFTGELVLRAEERNADLYAAVDLVIDKLEGQMRKLKTRNEKVYKNQKGLGETFVLDDVEAEDDDEEVVRTKSIALEPMSLDDAITRMEALGHSFFVYLDADDGHVSVAYRRLDGGYGVIEVENKLKEAY